MSYKIHVTIDGREYTLSVANDDGYIEKLADYVNDQIKQVAEQMHASSINATTMAAMNISDNYFHECLTSDSLRKELSSLQAENERLKEEQGGSVNLRKQLKEALEENSKLSKEIMDLRREIVRMGQKNR